MCSTVDFAGENFAVHCLFCTILDDLGESGAAMDEVLRDNFEVKYCVCVRRSDMKIKNRI